MELTFGIYDSDRSFGYPNRASSRSFEVLEDLTVRRIL